MGETSYSNFISAVNDFSALSNNITAICVERTNSYYQTGSSVGNSLGGAIGGFLGDGKGSRGESAGSFLGSFFGGAIGEAIADSRNRRDIAEAKAHIKSMLAEWRKDGLPIIKTYLETFDRTAVIHDMEIEYFIGDSKLRSAAIGEESIKHCTYLLRQCIASQFREIYDTSLGNNIIRYFNNYSRHLDNLSSFGEWQSKFLYVDKTECFKTAYDNVVGKVESALEGPVRKNFEAVLDFFASEVPAFLDTQYDDDEIFRNAEINALDYAESRITGKDTGYRRDYTCEGSGFRSIAVAAIDSFKRFEHAVIKAKVRKMEIVAGIGLPIFMLLNLIIKIYRWFNISSAFFRFFLCHYWGNVLSYVILSQLVILVAVLINKRKLAQTPFEYKGFWSNFNSELYHIRENAYETELQLPSLKIESRKKRSKKASEEVLSDDELMKLAGS